MYVYDRGGHVAGPAPRGARELARRVDRGGARCRRGPRCRRRPLPPRPAPAARRGEAWRGALPRRVRGRRRQRGAVHAGGLRPLRRRAPPVPRPVEPAAGADGRRGGRGLRHPAGARRSTRWRSRACTRRSRPRRSSAWRPCACPTGSARAATGGCPRSSLAPILRFADVEAFVHGGAGRRPRRHRSSTRSSRSGSRRRTSRTTSRCWPGPGRTSSRCSATRWA